MASNFFGTGIATRRDSQFHAIYQFYLRPLQVVSSKKFEIPLPHNLPGRAIKPKYEIYKPTADQMIYA
jgi:hypothetical protein